MLVPTIVPEWGSDAELFQELVPLPAKSTERPARATAKLGLVDWSLEIGIREGYYKPDSFELLSGGGKLRARRTSRLDVTALAAVMYKKHLREKIPPIPASPPQIKAMREARYDVELVLLEILKANKISGNPQKE